MSIAIFGFIRGSLLGTCDDDARRITSVYLRFPTLSNCLVTLVGICLCVNAAFADTPGFTSSGVSLVQPQDFTGTKGWSFYNYNQAGAIWITQLGLFDDDADGLENAHQVGLWRADGTLLASAIVPSGVEAALVGGYRYMPISPVMIPRATSAFDPTMAYIVAAQYANGDPDDLHTPGNAGFASGISAWTGGFASAGWYAYGVDLPFPNIRTTPPSEGTLGPAFWESNFQFKIPEPASWQFVGTGILLLLLRRRSIG